MVTDRNNDPEHEVDPGVGTEDQVDPEDRSAPEYEVDPDEGADAFETREEAEDERRTKAPERQDDDITTLDTPD